MPSRGSSSESVPVDSHVKTSKMNYTCSDFWVYLGISSQLGGIPDHMLDTSPGCIPHDDAAALL